MRFVSWYPLATAGEHAPPRAGVFQIRVASGLLDYPTGKSAMIYYACAPDLAAAVREFSASHTGRDWLCRHSDEMSPAELAHPERVLSNLLDQFERRFGSPPTLPP